MKKWLKGYFKDIAHNMIVHPLMCFMPAKLATKMHDANARWAYGLNRYDEIKLESAKRQEAERLAWMRLNETLTVTPQQHLAEVKAQAGRAGFVAGYMLCNDGSPLIKHNYEGFADQYAEQIRREVE